MFKKIKRMERSTRKLMQINARPDGALQHNSQQVSVRGGATRWSPEAPGCPTCDEPGRRGGTSMEKALKLHSGHTGGGQAQAAHSSRCWTRHPTALLPGRD
jgi:hypothetical protein